MNQALRNSVKKRIVIDDPVPYIKYPPRVGYGDRRVISVLKTNYQIQAWNERHYPGTRIIWSDGYGHSVAWPTSQDRKELIPTRI